MNCRERIAASVIPANGSSCSGVYAGAAVSRECECRAQHGVTLFVGAGHARDGVRSTPLYGVKNRRERLTGRIAVSGSSYRDVNVGAAVSRECECRVQHGVTVFVGAGHARDGGRSTPLYGIASFVGAAVSRECECRAQHATSPSSLPDQLSIKQNHIVI